MSIAEVGRTTGSRLPLAALALISVASLGLRLLRLGEPNSPVFDETYYLNAARDMVGLHDPAAPYAYHAGLDTNPEHPGLAKLLIGGSIRLLGDHPGAWRLPSVVFGTVAIVLMYWLVRSALGGPWLAVTASGLMAVDNLFFVHARIATLDIFVLVFMLAAAALYLRGSWAWAGVAIGVGMCTKLVAVDILLMIALLETGRVIIHRRFAEDRHGRSRRELALSLGGCAMVAAAVYLSLLGLLDLFMTSYRNPIAHTAYMLQHLSIRTGQGPPGVHPSPQSAPWQWLVDQVAIPYFRQQIGGMTILDFRGLIAPPIAYASVPAMAAVGWAFWRTPDELSLLSLSWFASTIGPFTLGAIEGKATYLYYMLIVLPAVYVAISRSFFLRPRAPVLLRAIFIFTLAISFVALFPLRTWSVIRPW